MINDVTYEALVDEVVCFERTPGFYAFVRIFTDLTNNRKENE